MALYIVRHGQTEENKQMILQGHMPGILTDEGIKQVTETAEKLAKMDIRFSCVVASDLKRAMDSAKIIADKLGIEVIPMEILRERDWGIYTGLTVEEARKTYRINGKWVFPDKSAETEEGIRNRANDALQKLKELYPTQNVIVVTHGQFARNLFAAHNNCNYREITSFANAEIRTLDF